MFSQRKKVFTPKRKLFSTEICFSPWKKSLLQGENFFLRKYVFHHGEYLGIKAFSWTVFLASSSIQRRAALQQRSPYWQAYKLLCDIFLLIVKTFFCGGKYISAEKGSLLGVKIFSTVENLFPWRKHYGPP